MVSVRQVATPQAYDFLPLLMAQEVADSSVVTSYIEHERRFRLPRFVGFG